MKKIISLLIVLTFVLGLNMTAMAEGYFTEVTYTASGTEEIMITVPAKLVPGGSGTVKLSGIWPTYKTIKISAPDTVTLTNSVDNDTEDVEIQFDGISQAGSNMEAFDIAKDITIEEFEPIFGTWTGKFDYTVAVEYAEVEDGVSLAKTGWKFSEDVSGYEDVIGEFRDEKGDPQWNPLPADTSRITGSYTDEHNEQQVLDYPIWGLCITNLGDDISLFGPVQSISEPWVFAYCPVDLPEPLDVTKGWYVIDGEMLDSYIYGDENGNHVTELEIAQNGLRPASAPTIFISEADPDDADYQTVVDTLTNPDIIAWLRQNAAAEYVTTE